jgi:hypothetical protein
MSNLHRELADGPSPAQDNDPLVFLGRFGAVFGEFELHASQKAKARGLDTTFKSVEEVKNGSTCPRPISYQQPRPDRSRLLHRQVGSLFQKDSFLNKKCLLKRGEFVLAEGRTAIDMVARFQFRAVGTNLDNDAGTVAADDGGPFINQKAGVLLQGLTGFRASAEILPSLMNRVALAHTGLMPTARHFTSACFGPGVERGRLLTMV